MDKEKRKELQNAYKNRVITGGIYCIKCSGNNRTWIRSTVNMEAAKNKVMSSLKLKGPPEPAMMRECHDYGSESFSFTVLEELKKGDDQTDKDFAEDLETLLEIWLEKNELGQID